jgi:hypothetical protein
LVGGISASTLAALSVTAGAASSAVAPRVIPAAAAQSMASGATSRVIIVLKNQETATPATPALLSSRQAAVTQSQAPVVQTLSQAGAQNVHSYTVLNALSATVPSSDVSALASSPSVAQVLPDSTIPLPDPTPAASGSASSATTGVPPVPGACAAPGKVQLDPEALEQIHANSDVPGALTAHSLGITGAGVKVGFIADGLDINDPDFIRPDGRHVFVDYKDFSGNGTAAPTGGEEAFGDAASIASQGREIYNVSNYSALPLNRPCYVRIEGVAPGASLVGLDIFGSSAGLNSSFLEAIDYAVTVDHVNVLNESLGSNYYPDDAASLDIIKEANDQAVAAGTTVVVSSGDAGSTSTIGTPATDPNVISAGATTTYRLDMQDGYGGARFPGVTGWLDNNISSFSSGGIEQDGQTVDVVAPGELNWSLCSTNVTIYQDCNDLAGNPSNLIAFGGTSESSPLTAGTAALVIQAYRSTHDGASPTPAQVKQIITSTADDIGAPADQQGAGLVNAYSAVKAAEAYGRHARAATPGGTLLTSSGQLDASAAPGTTEQLTDTVTNNGSSPETIGLSTRTIGAYTTIKTATVTLSDTASPNITDWQGINDNYEEVTFHVPGGQNRLNAAIAFQNASATDLAARVRLTLIDPNGKLAAYSVPQGDGNYGDVQVTDPAPGIWRAYIYSRDSADGGTTGPVVFGASVATYTAFGTVSPAWLHLAPGASAPVTLTLSTPPQPGDSSGAIVLDASDGSTTTIPVILRSLVPTGSTTFSGVLTGGNGRQENLGQTNYYQLNLPAGEPELNASVRLADNPNNVFNAWLIDPAGEAEAFAANNELVTNASGLSAVNTQSAQLHVLAPEAGTWTLVIAFAPQVSGVALSEPFSVSMSESTVPISASGLPDSAATQLAAGTPVTVPVTITNNGTSPDAYFIDPRLSASTQYDLAPLDDPDTTVPDNVNLAIPFYLVPSDTTSITGLAATTGTAPIQIDSSSPWGDPDIASNEGLSVSDSLSASPVTPGEWDIAPVEAGPFGAAAAPTEDVETAMLANTPEFDPAITSPTGDVWLTSVDPTAPLFNSVTINPGQSATIPVTITPSGASGSVVSGTLYVDDADLVSFGLLAPNANQLAAFPYEYTIK